MAVETFPRAQPSVLDRPCDLSRMRLEVVAYVLIVALSVLAHLWGLDRMAMHHDESIHAWTSWNFYKGQGPFTCWSGLDDQGRPLQPPRTSASYCYDPVYHGPSLYVLTFLSYFLFGDGDAQARLPMALAGIAMVASCWWLRPYLGWRGALIAAALLGFSPTLLYYTRFARHDGLMLLWELWMVIGVFRWLDTGRPGWLYLTAASIALAIGTHELYYILFFIFGLFILLRLIAESRFARRLGLGLLIVAALCVVLIIFNPPIPIGRGLYFGEKGFLVLASLLLAWLCQRLWDPRPLLTARLKTLWFAERQVLWVALAILGGIYVVLYTNFFSYPRGAIDGLYAGLAYWLGSQQDYARGDQPWYYYLMQLPLYEPLGVICGLGMLALLVTLAVRRVWAVRHPGAAPIHPQADGDPARLTVAGDDPPAAAGEPALATDGALPPAELPAEGETRDLADLPAAPDLTPAADHGAREGGLPLFPLLLVFWYFSAIILFSWAGEKMPWLTVHMSLPGNLLAAWVLGRLLRVADLSVQPAGAGDGSAQRADQPAVFSLQSLAWLVPLVFMLLLVALGVAMWRMSAPAGGQEAQSNLLQGIVPLLIGGGLIYTLLTLGQRLGARATLALAGLTLAAGIGGYMLRASWMAVYEHPDTPVEPLIYTQTSPDVPRYVQDVRELAINLTRNQRTSDDEAGGLTMPLIVDGGNSEHGGEGSLAWPLQWYLRDFKRLTWKDSSQIRAEPGPQTFEVQFPDGSSGLAPVVMLARPTVTDQVREVLSQHYAQPYGEAGVFNWWFPEGNECSPESPGYVRFYFNSWTSVEQLTRPALPRRPSGCSPDIAARLYPPWAPLVWPFLPENWSTLKSYLLYRDLPYPLTPGAREMEVWVRRDLVGGVEVTAVAQSGGVTLPLLAQQAIGGPDQLNGPTGVAVDSRGTIYVADTNNHRVQVYDADGKLLRTMGGFGGGPQQFYEPRGLAVDAQDNLYVADTWNARIVKYGPDGKLLKSWGIGRQELAEGRKATITEGTQAGNAAEPLGFFGPRGVAIDAQGHVYIADTGNKRIVVTDGEGAYLYQWGYAGAEPGAFNEPTGIAVDAQGTVYVADTWNGRVQVFRPQNGTVAPVPAVTWRVSGWKPNTYDDPSLAASPAGRVFVSVPSQQMVLAANLRGDVALRWGGPGDDLASLNAPSGMAVGPDGSVLVVDRQSNRVLRFSLPQVRP